MAEDTDRPQTEAAPPLDDIERLTEALRATRVEGGARMAIYHLPGDGGPKVFVKAVHDLSAVPDDPVEYAAGLLRDEGAPSGTYELQLLQAGKRGGLLRRAVARVAYRFPTPPPPVAPAAPSGPSTVDQVVAAISGLWRLARELQPSSSGDGASANPAATLQSLAAAVKDLRISDPATNAGQAAAEIGKALVGAFGNLVGPVLSALAQTASARAQAETGTPSSLRDLIGALRDLHELQGGAIGSAEGDVEGSSPTGLVGQVKELLGLMRELQETVAPAPRSTGDGLLQLAH